MSGQISSITNINGYLRWTTLDNSNNLMYNDSDGMLTGSTGGVIINRMKVSNDNSWDSFKDWIDYGSGTIGTMFETIADRRTALYNSGYWVDNLGRRRLINTFASTLRGSSANYLRTTAKFGKYAERAGWVSYALGAYEVGEGLASDGWKPSKNTTVAAAGVVGGIVGAAEGAIIGAYIGTFIPIPGAGTVLGFVIGAGVGYLYGEIATSVAEKIYE